MSFAACRASFRLSTCRPMLLLTLYVPGGLISSRLSSSSQAQPPVPCRWRLRNSFEGPLLRVCSWKPRKVSMCYRVSRCTLLGTISTLSLKASKSTNCWALWSLWSLILDTIPRKDGHALTFLGLTRIIRSGLLKSERFKEPFLDVTIYHLRAC